MYGGFSFCGIEIGKLGIQYAPDMASTFVYGDAYSEHTEAFEGHDGSLHYGTTMRPKSFRLRCYFEDSNINDSILDRVLNFFYRGRTGRLIFEQRDWAWYSATVTSVDTTQLRNYRNGFITINMTAHYPFARCDFMSVPNYEDVSSLTGDNTILDKTGFLTEDLVPKTTFTNITKDKTFHLYNPGNEYADVAIVISGEAGNGVTIKNITTDQDEGFLAFTKKTTTSAGQYIVCDSLNGKTILTDGTSSISGRIYHDYGFIRLEPARTIKRNIPIEISGNTLKSDGCFDINDVGKFIYIDNDWYKITEVKDNNELVIENPLGDSFSGDDHIATIAQMNEIVVQLGAGASLDKLEFIYKPTFR